jgi:dTMP kinase
MATKKITAKSKKPSTKKGAVKRGKLIVVDGIDGSGKATQVRLLAARLKKEGVKIKTIDFPRYGKNFFGTLIGEFLTGKYGDFVAVAPHIASTLYAGDRFESSHQIRKWLDEGYTVLADRYVSANQIHQGGKISDRTERQTFLAWLDKMEHGVFMIPRPDLVIYLDVPFEVSKEWLKQKVAQRKKAAYLKGGRDVAEDNLLHLEHSRNSALDLAATHKNWVKIQCCEGMVCLLPEGVHEEVFKVVKKKIGLRT